MGRGRRLRRFVNLLVCVALVTAGCGAESAVPPGSLDLTDLRVGMFSAGSTLPVLVAREKGIFERNGLRVELTEGSDLPVFMAALSKGQYDIVMSGPTLVLIGVAKKMDLQIISSMQRSSRERPNAVWITSDPAIDSLDKLKDKTIAVPSLTGIIVDALVYLLGRRGVGRDDVRFIQTPFPTMGDQLAAGHVDAVVASIPFNDTIAARGYRVHDDVVVEAVREASGGAVQSAMTSVWVASGSFAQEQQSAVTAWRTSLSQAVEYLDTHPDEAPTLMNQWLKVPPQVLARSPLPDWDVEISPGELPPYIAISRAVGATDTDPDVNELVWQGP
jgi:NitT/TauT family transport system substrate-binding protein